MALIAALTILATGLISFLVQRRLIVKLMATQLIFFGLWLIFNLIVSYHQTNGVPLIILLILNIINFWVGLVLISLGSR